MATGSLPARWPPPPRCTGKVHGGDAHAASRCLRSHTGARRARWTATRARFTSHTATVFALEDALCEHGLHAQPRGDLIDRLGRALLDTEFADECAVREETIVHDQARHREGVLALRAFESALPKLDPYLLGIDHRGIGRDKGPIAPRMGRREAQDTGQEQGAGAEWQTLPGAPGPSLPPRAACYGPPRTVMVRDARSISAWSSVNIRSL